MDNEMTEAQKEERFKAHFEKARKGVLKHIVEKGGALSMGEMHDYSLNKYLIQHQKFSEMMEALVDNNLITYDYETQLATITEAGKNFIQSQ